MNATIRLEDLRILLNAVFVKKEDGSMDDSSIHALVQSARSNIEDGTAPLLDVFREQRAGSTIKVTASVFYSTRDANFLPANDLYDSIASYIVIVEIDEKRAAIFKKGCASIKAATEKKFVVVSYENLLGTFDDSRAEIQKLSAREMNVSDKGIRYRSYEAPDLKGHMSPHSAGRSIPKFTRVRTKNEVSSLGLTTGRINQLTDRTTILEAADWVRRKFDLMERKRADNSFFGSFAQRIELSQALLKARPANILFERSSIEDDVNTNGLIISYSTRKGTIKRMPPKLWKKVLRAFDAAYEVEETTFRLLGTRDAKLRVNQRTISPQSRGLQRIKVGEGKSLETLQAWITSSGYFTISFDRPEYIYVDRHCFVDRAGKSEIESILKCLEVRKELTRTKSEKGKPLPGPADLNFPPDSLFAAIERIHGGESHVFCDDLGDEWADHICLDTKAARVTFIHSKHYGKTSNSASALHEVVGQAVKNLGNMHFTQQSFSKKITKFKKKYSATQIKRARIGDLSLATANVKGLLADHRLHRKCVIACPYLSKSSIEAEFKKMKSGASVRGHITQLFWILSSFIHCAMGSSVVPVVYCKR